jgi:acetyltransferase-like isoleucine patch superfamily enzyme
MKQIIKKIIRAISYPFYLVFSPKLFSWLNIRVNQFYSIWKANEFKKAGSSFYFQYPLYLHGGKHITIGEGFCCDHRLRLDAWDEFLGDKFTPEIIIGNNVSIQKDCHIGAIDKIVIGNNVLLASKVYISDHSHGEITKEELDLAPSKRKLFSKGPVFIENNVWLGEGVVVLSNVTIGENSIVGANSVVTKSIPKNSVVAGNPARIIRELV